VAEPQLLRDRVDRFVSVGLLLVAAQLVIRAVVLSGGFFWQDDYIYLADARADGLSADYLFQDYNDHLMPAQFLGVSLLTLVFDRLPFGAAATSMVVMQGVASVLLLWCLTVLFGRRTWVLVPFALYLFTPLALAPGTWWAAALQALPLQIWMLAAAGSACTYFTGGSRRWAVASVACFAVGLLFWQKALLILPAVLGIHFLLQGSGLALRVRLRRLWDRRAFWAAYVAVAIAYVSAYVSLVDFETTTSEADVSVGRVLDAVLVQTLVPGILGGPWTGDGADNTLAPLPSQVVLASCLVVVAAAIVASFVVSGSAAGNGWLLIAAYLAMDIALVVYGRVELAVFLARDPRYIADALPIIALGVAGAFAGSRARRRSATAVRQRLLAVATPTVAACLIVLLATASLLTTREVADEVRHEYSRHWAEAALAAYDRDPTRVLVDTSAPAIEVVARPVSVVFGAAGVPVLVDWPTTQLEVLDALGRPRPVEIRFPAVEARGPRRDCGWPVSDRPVTLATLETALPRATVVRLGYLTGRSSNLSMSVGGTTQSLQVMPGLGLAWFVVDEPEGDLVVEVADDKQSLCISDLVVGAAWPEE
jgi:hypothetical protein